MSTLLLPRSAAVALAIPLCFAAAPYLGAGMMPHELTPPGIVLQGCSQPGCPTTQQYATDAEIGPPQ